MSPFSLAERIARLPPELRGFAVDAAGNDAARILRAWRFWARPAQLAPAGDWDTWLVLAGRGWGKSFCGAHWIHEQVEAGAQYIALVAATAADARDTMVEKASGIIKTANPDFRPEYEPTKRRLTWPTLRGSRAMATLFSAEEPERLRGPEHEVAWLDEFGAYGANAQMVWDMLQLGLRRGRPRALITTTGRRLPALRAIADDPRTRVTRGATYDNQANLPASFLRSIARRYEGTRLGLQELLGEILPEDDGAMFTGALIEAARRPRPSEFRRIVVAVDPAITAKRGSDLTGVLVVGLGFDGRYYVLDDLTASYTPEKWRAVVVAAYRRHDADAVVVERNRGGDLVSANLRTEDRTIRIVEVLATRGKALRAEPVLALYEQGKVSHVLGARLEKLELEMTGYNPATDDDRSPNRLDSLVWALWELAKLGDGAVFSGDYESAARDSRVLTKGAPGPASEYAGDYPDEDDERDDDGGGGRNF